MKNGCSLLFIFLFFFAAAQKGSMQVVVVGFYNLENLYDTIDNTVVQDDEFLPSGRRHYNGAVYRSRLERLATVIARMGKEVNPEGAIILGVAEVENDTVLRHLVHHPLISARNYKMVHYDSRDARGVDVALLYQPHHFKVEKSRKLYVTLPDGAKDALYTRDVLWVRGRLGQQLVHIYVNHWPSRLGGEKRTAPAREAAAWVVKNHMDSVMRSDTSACIMVMGDFNDEPVSSTITRILKASPDLSGRKPLFNPWTTLFKKGIGSLAYRDAWSLFDQILLSRNLVYPNDSGFYFTQAFVFNPPFLTEDRGRWKGYPKRAWDGLYYQHGYSDHYPVYIIFGKRGK